MSSSNLSIACGWGHTVVVPGSGLNVVGWGLGPDGQLSTNKGFTEFGAQILEIPQQWFGSGQGRTIADVGDKHTAIIADGSLYTMGSSENGRLGHDKKHHGKVKFPFKRGKEQKVKLVACGAAFNVAVVGHDSKDLFSWGIGTYGNLGTGIKAQMADTPQFFQIIDAETHMPKQVEKISCGSEHVLALCKDGQVYSWGRGTSGRLGHGNSKMQAKPTLIEDLVVSSQERVVMVAAGDAHSMALNKEGRVYTWGMGSYGRLGLGTSQNVHSPRVVSALSSKFVTHISCHTFHSLAVVRSTGFSLYTWGGGQYGKLGHGGTNNELLPRQVAYFGYKRKGDAVIVASCGLEHTACVTKSGHIFAWGYCLNRRCGFDSGRDSKKSYLDEPHEIPGLDPKEIVGFQGGEQQVAEQQEANVMQVACGAKHSVARLGGTGNTDTGYLMAWGSNEYGQMGTGPHKRAFKPIRVLVSMTADFDPAKRITHQTSIKHVCCGDYHTIAVSRSGNVFTWGRNHLGQLGLGHRQLQTKPRLVELLQGEAVRTVSAGGDFCAAVPYQPEEGDPRFPYIFVWGDGSKGQLGLGKEFKVLDSPEQLKMKIPPVKIDPHHNRWGLEVALGSKHMVMLVHHPGETTDASDSSRKGGKNNWYSVVYTCGEGRHGKLGLDDFDDRWTLEKVKFQEISGKEFTEKKVEKKDYRIDSVHAGLSSSFAVLHHSKFQRSHTLYGWGKVNGVFPGDVNSPREVDLSKVLSRANSSSYGTTEYRVVDGAVASDHSVFVLENGERRNEVVAFGMSRYGKLGIGNVIQHLEDQQKQGANKRQHTIDRAYPPVLIAHLHGKDVMHVASCKDHNLAASKDNVFVWGHAGDGRLGLGEFESARSETVPKAIKVFQRNQGADDDDNELDDDVDALVLGGPMKDGDELGADAKEDRGFEDFLAKPRGNTSMKHLDQRIDSIKNTVLIEEKIRKKIEIYNKAMHEYSGAFERYADKGLLIRKAVLERMREHHPVEEEEDEKRYAKKLQTISYQPVATDEERIAEAEQVEGELVKMDDPLTPYDLNPLERLVARIHMAPIEFFSKIYEPAKKRWKESIGFLSPAELMDEKKAFVNLVTSVYDANNGGHFGRFLVLLKLILRNHNETTKNDSQFMAPTSVEWLLLCAALQAGPMRRKLKLAITPALVSIKYPQRETKKGKTPWMVICAKDSEYSRVSEALGQIRNMVQYFIRTVAKKYVEPLMDYSAPVTDVFYDVTEKHYREYMLGEIFVKSVIEVVLEDLPFFYNPDRMEVEQDCLRFILKHLRYEAMYPGDPSEDTKRTNKRHRSSYRTMADAQDFLLKVTKDTECFEELQKNIADHVGDFNDIFNPRRLYDVERKEDEFEALWRSPFTIFLEYIKTLRAKMAQEKKDRSPGGAISTMKNILSQFLKDRSTFDPYVLQIPLQALHLFLMPIVEMSENDDDLDINRRRIYWKRLLRNELGSVTPDIEMLIAKIFDNKTTKYQQKYHMLPRGACTNVRLDLFMADQHLPVVNNWQCENLWTPEYTKTAKPQAQEQKRADFGKQRTLEVTEEQCVKLYFTLKGKEYQDILVQYGSKNAWVEIIKALSKARESALEDADNNHVQHLEWCRRMIRKFAVKDKATIIKLGVPDAARQNSSGARKVLETIEGIPQATLDPLTLMERLRRVDYRCQMSNMKLLRNLQIITDVIEHVVETTERVKEEDKLLVDVFRTLSRSTEQDTSSQNLHKFYGIWQNQKDHTVVRKHHAVHVSMIMGSVVTKTYEEMCPQHLDDLTFIANSYEGTEPKWQATETEISQGYCCVPKVEHEHKGVTLAAFKDGLKFCFFTSERPDLVHLEILYREEANNSCSCTSKAPKETLIMSLDFTLRAGGLTGVTEITKASTQEPAYGQNVQVIYDPLGDPVPVRKRVKFRFKDMNSFLKSSEFHRPNKVFDVNELLTKSQLQELLLDVF